MIKLISIGSDPEFAIGKKIVKKNIEKTMTLPSFLFIKGTKDDPESLENGFFILKDNLLIEGNIPPSKTKAGFIDNMAFLKDLISVILRPENAFIIEDDVVEYEKDHIYTDDGQEFACSSFRDPYLNISVVTPIIESDKRPIGGHIHIGYESDNKDDDYELINRRLAKVWDYFVVFPSDEIYYSEFRRKNYGKYGSYRDTSYGMEFRALGGYFMKDEFLGWIYDQTVKTVNFVNDVKNHAIIDELIHPSKDNYKILNINFENQIPRILKK